MQSSVSLLPPLLCLAVGTGCLPWTMQWCPFLDFKLLSRFKGIQFSQLLSALGSHLKDRVQVSRVHSLGEKGEAEAMARVWLCGAGQQLRQ